MVNHYEGEGETTDDGEPHVLYNFNPDLDSDIADAHQHLEDTEIKLGHTFQVDSLLQSEVANMETEFSQLEQKAKEKTASK